MRAVYHRVTFKEIPDEICLAILVAGCRLKCPGCHSAEAWNEKNAYEFELADLIALIGKYRAALTCVLFLGGEWQPEELVRHLKYCKTQNLATALYTGEDDVLPEIKAHLTYLKTGRWVEDLGGLESPQTNQKLIQLTTGRQIYLNNRGGKNDQTHQHSN